MKNMKVIAIVALLVSFTAIRCNRHYYILTRFKDIQGYAFKMVQHQLLGNKVIQEDHASSYKKYTRHVSFCKSLLTAPIFEILSEVEKSTLKRVDRGFHRIDTETSIQFDRQSYKSTLKIETCYIARQKFDLPTYKCLDHDSRLTWLGSYDNNEATGFLFTTVPVNSIYSLIDLTVQMTNYKKVNTTEFEMSIEKADPLHSESLCNLKKLSQFRICAICADSIHRYYHFHENSPYHRYLEGNPSIEEYADPYFNYFNDEPYEKNDYCPNIAIHKYHVAALYCATSIKNASYNFHIKRNLISGNSVFLIGEGKIRGESKINQLQNILNLDHYL